MQYVLTLTGDEKLSPLTNGHVKAVKELLLSKGSIACSVRWLSKHTAVDISFNRISIEVANESVRKILYGVPVDVNIQKSEGRRKKVLIADMDSTIIMNESLDDLARFAGLQNQIEPITEQAMRGEIDFELALRKRVQLLTGQPEALITQFLTKTVKITPGALGLVKTMKLNGAITALISGGFSSITNPIATQLGFDINLGNQLLIKDGKLTGDISFPIVNSATKLDTLIAITKEKNISLNDTMAVGDGANDIPMIENAGTGIAFRAKLKVKEAAPFSIDHGDLKALLYLQGYHSDEIIE
jgi:phosphoserine phosphatase